MIENLRNIKVNLEKNGDRDLKKINRIIARRKEETNKTRYMYSNQTMGLEWKERRRKDAVTF